MSKSHLGSNLPLKDLILPIDYQDTLLNFQWNKVSGRGHEPVSDITTIVPDNKFGQVVAIEEATTNLLTNSNGRPLNLAGQGTTPPTVSLVSDSSNPFGTEAWAITFQTNSAATYSGSRAVSNSYPITINLDYALTTWIKIEDSDEKNITMYHTGANGTASLLKTGRKIGMWKEYSVVYKLTAASGHNYLTIYLNNTLSKPMTIYIGASQAEQKSYATSYVNGARGSGSLSYDKDILNPSLFTVNTWFKVNTQLTTYQGIFDICSSSHQLNRMLCMVESTANTISFWASNDTHENNIVTNFAPVIGQWHMLTVTYDGSKYIIYADGKMITSQTSTIVVKPLPSATLNIGGRYWGRLNGYISNFLISPRSFSADDINNIYQYGKPLYDPYDYYATYG